MNGATEAGRRFAQFSPQRRWAASLAATALAIASLTHFGLGTRGLISAGFVCCLAVLAAIDLECRLIPNRIVLPAAGIVLAAQIVFFPGHALEWIVAGLGKRDEFDPERARVVAGAVLARARELGAKSLCWELPHHVSDAHASAFVEGSVMGAYRFTMWKSKADDDENDNGSEPSELIVSAHHDVAAPVEAGRVIGESVNLTRDLQNRPANDMTPTALGERAVW